MLKQNGGLKKKILLIIILVITIIGAIIAIHFIKDKQEKEDELSYKNINTDKKDKKSEKDKDTNTTNKPASNEVSTNNWLSNIKDDTLLSNITIPGVHDAATCYVQMSFVSQCQNKTIKELLDNGFRYFDMRLGADNENGRECLRFFHGATSCLESDGLGAKNLYLDSVLSDCYSFLDSNPTECILFCVLQENDKGGLSNFQNILNNYIGQKEDKWLLTDNIPSMSKARGKIVLFRRYNDEANLATRSGISLSWNDQGNSSDSNTSYEENQNNGYPLIIQDRYKYNKDDKWNVFEQTIQKKMQANGCLAVNFLSTTGSGLLGQPSNFASDLNKRLLQKDLKGNLGWIIVDFGDSNISKHIYEANFN